MLIQKLIKLYKASHMLPVLVPVLGYFFLDWGAEDSILFMLLEIAVVFFISWLFTFVWAFYTKDSYQRYITLIVVGLIFFPLVGAFLFLAGCYIVYLVIFVLFAEFPEDVDKGANYEGFKPFFFAEKILEKWEIYLFSEVTFPLELLALIIPVTVGLVLFTMKNKGKDVVLWDRIFEAYGNFFFGFAGLFIASWFTGLFKNMGAALVCFAFTHWYMASKAEDEKKEKEKEQLENSNSTSEDEIHSE